MDGYLRSTGPPADSCPYTASEFFDDAGAVYWPISCKRVTCPYCGPRYAYGIAGAVALALGPGSGSGLLTYPTLGGDFAGDPAEIWRTFAPLIHRFLRKIMESGVDFRAAYVIERSEAGRAHVHLVHWADRPVSTGRFVRAGKEAGLGYTNTQPVKTRDALARYILKVPLDAFNLAPAAAEALLIDFKALNGGRLITTRGNRGPFWRDARGYPIRGARKARAGSWAQLRAHGLSRAEIGEESRLVRRERLQEEEHQRSLHELLDFPRHGGKDLT